MNQTALRRQAKSKRAFYNTRKYSYRHLAEFRSVDDGEVISLSNTDTGPIEEGDALSALCDIANGKNADVGRDYIIKLLESSAPILNSAHQLRQMARHEGTERKKPYPGLRAKVDPIQFLSEQYGEDIASGNLGPGQLSLIDNTLYTAIRYRLRDQSPPKTMQEFFEGLRLPSAERRSPRERRAYACAILIGQNVEAATRFFSGARIARANEEQGRKALIP